jgi:sugar phosphate isomerase/epimerase
MSQEVFATATATAPVLISLSSFGAAEVRRHGQAWFTRLCREAGADGVEVRGELLPEVGQAMDDAIDAIAEAAGPLQRVYSSPEGLFAADGALDEAALDRALNIADWLAAPRLKMSIGGFDARARATPGALRSLATMLDGCGVELVIENDQTVTAGTQLALQRFFAACDAAGLRLGMTFDVGNWHWTGECPQQAAAAFAARVVYVHCKGVQRQPARWVAVPLADSAAPWRAVLRALPARAPWAIEYPLVGDDLVAVIRDEIALLRETAGSLS